MFFCFCLFITKAKRSCYQQNVNLRVRRAVRRNEGQRGRTPEILGDCSPDSAVWVGTETFSRQKGAHFFVFNKLEGHPLNPHRPSYSYSTHKKKKKNVERTVLQVSQTLLPGLENVLFLLLLFSNSRAEQKGSSRFFSFFS